MSQNGADRPSSSRTTTSVRDNEPPTFDAFRTSDGICLAFWCDYCERLHYHGACGPKTGEGNGHRAAHCDDPASPYRRTGYFIREVSRILWVMVP